MEFDLNTELVEILDSKDAWNFRIVPKASDEKSLTFYTDSPSQNKRKSLQFRFQKSVEFSKINTENLEDLLSTFYQNMRGEVETIEMDTKYGEQFLDLLIEESQKLKSSDIHLEIFEEEGRVRLRVDGHLLVRYKIKPHQYNALINRVKIKASLDIAEKRLPQDGRIAYHGYNSKLDIRVSTVPTLHGEKVVLRLLNKDTTNISIDSIGLHGDHKQNYVNGFKKPSGIIIISGPTGSGKTTTLYATLKQLNEIERNILTIEDPIEYTLEGINQVQLKENIGLTFPKALRSFLRQDPDVIMLGEIRDRDTAEMAVRASLTGHLVLSTIHTPSALDIVYRLQDLGVPSFLMSTTLNTLVAQRLVRRLCDNCKESDDSEEALKLVGESSEPKKAKGCSHCHFTGYKGRVALFEVIQMDEDLKTQIRLDCLNTQEYMSNNKINSLRDEALKSFLNGVTSLEEIKLYL